MKNYFIIASANSRLQADIILIRLRQANVSCRKISVLYPTQSLPNGVGCWLPISTTGDLKASGNSVSRAGQMVHQRMKSNEVHDDGREIVQLLLQAGIDRPGAQILAERLSQGHILLGVHASSEDERSIVWHVLYDSCADTIVVGRGADPQPARASHELEPEDAGMAAAR